MLTYTMLTLDSYVHLLMLKRKGVLFNQCIVSRVFMALVYICNTIT